MRTIVITPPNGNSTKFRAVIGEKEFFGKTAGEALDALALDVEGEKSETIYFLQRCQPDEFFNAQQLQRLSHLMEKLHEAEAESKQLSADERAELEQLIDEELDASGKRAAKIASERNK